MNNDWEEPNFRQQGRPVSQMKTEQPGLPFRFPSERRRDSEPNQQERKPSRFMAILKRLGGSKTSLVEPPSDTSGTSTPSLADNHELPKPLTPPMSSIPIPTARLEYPLPKPAHRQHSRIVAQEDLETFTDIEAPWNESERVSQPIPESKRQKRSKVPPPVELPTFPASNASLVPFTKAVGYGNCLLSSAGAWTAYTILLSMSYNTPLDPGLGPRQKVAHLHLLRPSNWGSTDRKGNWEPLLVEVERRALSHKTIVKANLAVDPVILVKFRDPGTSPAWSIHVDRWGQRQTLLQHMQAMIYLVTTEHNFRERATQARFQEYPANVRKLAAMSNGPLGLADSDDVSPASSTSSLDRFYIQQPSQHPNRLNDLAARTKPIDIFPLPVSQIGPRIMPTINQPRPIDEAMRRSRAPGTEKNMLQLRIIDPAQPSPPSIEVPYRSRPSQTRRRARPEDERQAMREIADNVAFPVCPISVPMKRDITKRQRRTGVIGAPSLRPPPMISLPPVPSAVAFRGPTSLYPTLPGLFRSTQASEDLQEILQAARLPVSAHENSQSELLRGLALPRPPRRTTNYPPVSMPTR